MDGPTVSVLIFLAAQTAAGLIWGSRLHTIVTRLDSEVNRDPGGLRVDRHKHANILVAHEGTLDDHEGRINDLRDDVRGLIGIREVRK